MARETEPAPGTPEYEAKLEIGRQLREQIVSKVHALIRERNLTQKQVASMAGMTQQAVSLFMSKPDGPISLDRLLTLMAALNMVWVITETPGGPSKEVPVKAPRTAVKKRKPTRKRPS